MTFKARGVALVVAAAVVAVLPATALAQKDDKKRSGKEREEIEVLVKIVDGAMAGQTAPSDVQMKIEPVFLKSQEARMFVPFTLDVTGFPAGKDAALYIRVVDPAQPVDPKKKVEYPWDDVHFVPAAQLAGTPVRLNRVFMAKRRHLRRLRPDQGAGAGEGQQEHRRQVAGCSRPRSRCPT